MSLTIKADANPETGRKLSQRCDDRSIRPLSTGEIALTRIADGTIEDHLLKRDCAFLIVTGVIVDLV